MKKILFLFAGILSIILGLSLSSCANTDDIVGFWIISENQPVDEKKILTLEELLAHQAECNVEYYVDGYSSDTPISHLNNSVPWYFSYQYESIFDEHFEIIDVFQNNDGYYLERNGVVIPYSNALNPHNSISMARTIKGKECTIIFYAPEVSEAEA